MACGQSSLLSTTLTSVIVSDTPFGDDNEGAKPEGALISVTVSNAVKFYATDFLAHDPSITFRRKLSGRDFILKYDDMIPPLQHLHLYLISNQNVIYPVCLKAASGNALHLKCELVYEPGERDCHSVKISAKLDDEANFSTCFLQDQEECTLERQLPAAVIYSPAFKSIPTDDLRLYDLRLNVPVCSSSESVC